jgi:hypothetical protein
VRYWNTTGVERIVATYTSRLSIRRVLPSSAAATITKLDS